MKVKAANGKGEVYELENNTARALIAAGTLVEYKPPVSSGPTPQTTWKVGWLPSMAFRTAIDDSVVFPETPAIIATCGTCGEWSYMTGPSAHKTQRFLHCRINETIPAEIIVQYAALLKKDIDRRPKPHAEVKRPHFVEVF